MAWNEAVVTVSGIAMVTELINGGNLKITKAEISENTVNTAALALQTAVSSPLDVPVTISSREKIDGGLSICVQIRNTGVVGSHRMKQLGIYAKTETTEERLFAILQDQIGEDIPPESEYPKFLLEHNSIIAVSNTDRISVTINPASVVITLEQLNEALKGYVEKAEGMVLSENNFTDELKEKYDGAHEHISQMDNPHSVTKSQVGLGNVPDVATNDQTPTYTEAGTLTALTSGEKLSAAFGKISKAVKDLISHIGDNVRHITAAERTAWNGKAAGSHNHDSRYYTESQMNTKLASKADSSHTHSASDINSGILSVSSGGTGNSTGYITAGQKAGTTLGSYSTAEGFRNTSSGSMVHAEGIDTIASGLYSHSEGEKTNSSARCSHAEGNSSTASGAYAHAEGQKTIASGENSHAEGYSTNASGEKSHASGDSTIASSATQFVCGQYNVEYNSGGAYIYNRNAMFLVGSGTAQTRSNCLRVGFTSVWGGEYHSTGADYAEYFEWLDGNSNNEDRRGLFVALDGDKIRIANPSDDFILGIVSGNPSIVGDSHDDQWNKMYVSDIFGTPVYEDVEVPAETDKDGNIIVEAHTEIHRKINPNFDNSQKYEPRSERPEWDAVGMMGKLVAVDDGSCNVNEYCRVGENGTAAHSGVPTKFRVMKRLDDNHILILVV